MELQLAMPDEFKPLAELKRIEQKYRHDRQINHAHPIVVGCVLFILPSILLIFKK